MGTIAVAERNAMLDAFASGTTYSGNSAFWVKLHTGDPGAAGANNAAAETTRKQASFAAAAAGSKATNADLTWDNVSTSETYTHVSYWTAGAAGTFLGSDDLSSSAVMVAGQTFRIPSGSLTLNITGPFTDAVKNAMLDAYGDGTDYTGNAAVWVKLHLGAPGAAGANNPATETTRKQLTFGTPAAAGSIANTAVNDWASYPAAETVTHYSFWTANAAGTFLGSDDLATSQAMGIGETFRLRVGDFVAALS